MGVGKGRTARALAKKTTMYSVDCDDLIESFANMKIKKIFKKLGETYFRELEKKTALWLEGNLQATIISTGGGFVNIPNLNNIGLVVYLHASFSRIIDGILTHPNAKKKIKKRPLLKDLSQAEALYKTRLPLYYEKADYVVEVEDKSIEEIAEEIYLFYRENS